VKVENPPLPFGEPTDVQDALRLNAHALQRGQVRDRRDD